MKVHKVFIRPDKILETFSERAKSVSKLFFDIIFSSLAKIKHVANFTTRTFSYV